MLVVMRHDDGLRRIERGVENAIRDAIDGGELRDLPGAGAPLPRDEGPDDDRWAAMRVLKSANALPEWAALRREIDDEREALARRARRHLEWLGARRDLLRTLPAEQIFEATRVTASRDAEVRNALVEAVADLNRRIDRYNRLVPVPNLQLSFARVERIFELAAED